MQEVIPGGMNLTSAFTYDYENRLTAYGVGGTNFSVEHTYDGYNRLVKTDATIGANTQNFEHVYAGRQHLGNIETTGQPVNGKVWKWEAGAGMPNAGPIESPQRYTASATQFYMVSDERNVERKSYRVASITAGDYNDDSRYAEWQQVNGGAVPCRPALMAYKSELFSAYAVTLDADRASSAATNHALQLAASDLEYEGTRVKSPVLGRDLNPMGRGDGAYYADGGNTHGGSVAVGRAKPLFVGNVTGGYGSNVNNFFQDLASGDLGHTACCCITRCTGPSLTGGPPSSPFVAADCCSSFVPCLPYSHEVTTYPDLDGEKERKDLSECTEQLSHSCGLYSCAYNYAEYHRVCDAGGSGILPITKEWPKPTSFEGINAAFAEALKRVQTAILGIESACARECLMAASLYTTFVLLWWDVIGPGKTNALKYREYGDFPGQTGITCKPDAGGSDRARTFCAKPGIGFQNEIAICMPRACFSPERYLAFNAAGKDIRTWPWFDCNKRQLDSIIFHELVHICFGCSLDCPNHTAMTTPCAREIAYDVTGQHSASPPLEAWVKKCRCCNCWNTERNNCEQPPKAGH